MLLWKAKLKRIVAQEVLTEGCLQCEAGRSIEYLKGLAEMAWELGLISQKEKEDFLHSAQNSAE
jgi:hypothetical protein